MSYGWVKRSAALLAVSWLIGAGLPAAAADGQQSAEELRNTVINLLDALVQKGVITAEQAKAMVADAQAKAEAEAKKRAEQEVAEKDAVRVPYIPETVRDELSKEIRGQLRDEVKRDVITEAQEERWGVPGALPEWVNALQFFGDVRVRAEDDNYARNNATNTYLNLNAVNAAGGIDKAGAAALLDTTTDRQLMFGRFRFGLDAQLGNAFTLDARVSSGSTSPVSANQQLGTYGQRWFLGVDRAGLLWNPTFASGTQELDLRFGRFANPFVTYNELVWDVDLGFEGASATYALDLFRTDAPLPSRTVFVTAGAFPLQSLGQLQGDLTSEVNSKWLYGAQIGGEVPYGDGHRVRLSFAYYDFVRITGVENPPDGTIDNFTAPPFFQKGNTVFDISNSTDPTVNLFALAGKYREANANVLWDVAGFGPNRVILGADFVKNLGWNEQDVFNRTGQLIAPRVIGWEVGIEVGRPTLVATGQWRAFFSYKSVQRDAVVDAFTDSDFHLGGTDARGYIVGFDVGLSTRMGLRLRYLSANAIDGPPLGIDVLQLDLLGHL
jgi:polyhydroxyalkanoate synthesis regulator phasin